MENKDKKIYKFHGKEYVAVDEMTKGCCKGCAFINRTDCEKSAEKMAVCHDHKIFMRHLQHTHK